MAVEAKCDLCKETLNIGNISELGKWVFHPGCYRIVLQRLACFMELLLLPQAEFDEWLADDAI